jgi:hypothetical protein
MEPRPILLQCPRCQRHLRAEEPCCPFCCQRLNVNAALAMVALAGLAGCPAPVAAYGVSPGVAGTFGGTVGAAGNNGGNGAGGNTTGGATQYCGIPDAGTPIPCDELDGGEGTTGSSGSTDGSSGTSR